MLSQQRGSRQAAVLEAFKRITPEALSTHFSLSLLMATLGAGTISLCVPFLSQIPLTLLHNFRAVPSLYPPHLTKNRFHLHSNILRPPHPPPLLHHKLRPPLCRRLLAFVRGWNGPRLLRAAHVHLSQNGPSDDMVVEVDDCDCGTHCDGPCRGVFGVGGGGAGVSGGHWDYHVGVCGVGGGVFGGSCGVKSLSGEGVKWSGKEGRAN